MVGQKLSISMKLMAEAHAGLLRERKSSLGGFVVICYALLLIKELGNILSTFMI